ncbi:MAG: hypothetical protein BA871_11085 [Desulfuromonadales bacterium C00003096]|jgi:hypothetical protein|nr:MAG: hypothetical protein BA871_11085 [Desulfuromonadales bacterium C00003096]
MAEALGPSACGANKIVSVRKRFFSAVAASIFELACAAYQGTPPRKPLIALPRRKIPRFRLGNMPGVHPAFPDGNKDTNSVGKKKGEMSW